ncbi:restriction endonuclease subunit S [Marinobacter sp.]|uniref:restriction endonuclease subunit S n=1 Tax=Marinobacter sp. TaxID=50741 RepID=UPI001B419196|nr:restriction endonuclease subunit S [Marinobacter sp.]MBQ0833558.1 restriction endonuclease subunit S [Marinobacter sp.]
MGSEWAEARLGDVVELKRGYDLPRQNRQPGLAPIISSSGVSDFHSIAKIEGPGVITGRYGTIGEVFYCAGDFWPLNTTLYVKDFKGNDEKFIYYFLKTIHYQEYSDKGAVPGVNRNHLHTAEVYIPKKVSMQRKIAGVLSALDEKIDLNRQMNTTLEAMAQALFKSWFVDFDPVIDKALAAGNPIPEPLHARADARKALGDQRKPLPATIHQQFPDRFVFTEELGWVPEGWEIKSVIDMVDSVSDTFPLKNTKKVIFLNTGDISEGRFLHREYSASSGLPGQAKKSIKRGDILFSEIRPKNKRYAFVDFDASDYVVSTKLMVLRVKEGFRPLITYFLLRQEQSVQALQQMAESRSGTFPQITYRELSILKQAVPSDGALFESFETSFLTNFSDRSQALESQCLALERLRNTLLPKLLSGELRVPEAEATVASMLAEES